MLSPSTIRRALLILSALGAVCTAVDIYLHGAAAITWAGVLAAGTTGLIGWATRTPGLLTPEQAQELADSQIRALSSPPPAVPWRETATPSLADELGIDLGDDTASRDRRGRL